MKSFIGLSLIILSFFFLVKVLKLDSSIPLNPVKNPQYLLDIQTLDNTLIRSLFINKKRLIHFYASWCRPCQKELPSLLSYLKTHQDLKLALLCLDNCPKIEGVDVFYLPNNLDITIPQSLYLDESNSVKWSHVGAYSWNNVNFL